MAARKATPKVQKVERNVSVSVNVPGLDCYDDPTTLKLTRDGENVIASQHGEKFTAKLADLASALGLIAEDVKIVAA